MKKSYVNYVKSLNMYDSFSELDVERILAVMKLYKDSRKKQTSVALDEVTLHKLYTVAKEQGVPYQVLIRISILAGLERWQKASV